MVSDIQVLHVDDEPSFGDLVANLLEREEDRFDVVTETSAADGLVFEPTQRVTESFTNPLRSFVNGKYSRRS